ncbi:MAG: aldehyde ferredoxin oxidoreductase C-terminal domain-containing protein, partial [Candidatus Bathyarchaeia archaeon]
FAMECFQKGILTERETHGLRLEFGNHEAMVEAVRKIAFREAIGDQMAEGVARWSETLGPEAERYAMHVKGLELPAYDPRGAKGMALEYATSPRGGCHERGLLSQETFGVKPHVDRLSYEGKPELLRKVQIRTAVLDSLGACIFPMQNATIPMEELTDLYAAVTGFSVSTDELWLAGERILTLERLFNVREGFNRRADILPSRLLEEPLPDGASKGEVVSLSPLLDRYYEVMGWNENGIPTPEKLAQLDLPQNWQAG